MGKLFRSLKQAAVDFSDDDCMSSGAAIAYYAIFSMPPLLVLVVSLAAYFGVPQQRIDELVRSQLGIDMQASEMASQAGPGQQQSQDQGQDPEQPQSSGQGEGESPQSQPGAQGQGQDQGQGADGGDSGGFGWVWRVIGGLLLLFSATGLFAQLQYALNRAWEVQPDPQQGGILKLLFKRLLSFGMILVVAFLLLISLVLTTIIDQIVALVQGGGSDTVTVLMAGALNMAATLIVATLLFAAMYKVLPDAKMAWRDVWIGAAITALLFVIGKTLIGIYLRYSNVGSGWDAAAASTIGVLVWIYYTSLIVLFGAELTQVYAKEFGQGIEPAEGAIPRPDATGMQRDKQKPAT